MRAAVLLALGAVCVAAEAFVPSASALPSKQPTLMKRIGRNPAAGAPAGPLAPVLMTASEGAAPEPAVAGEAPLAKLWQAAKVPVFITLWYLFNIGYNISNKKALNALDLPWTIALIQLVGGLLYVFPLWLTGLRKAPKLSMDNVKTLTPVASMHLGTHIGAVISLGAGAVSFTHIVKAGEPVVSALLSAVVLKKYFSLPTYLSLIPVVAGVGLASAKELSFTWLGFAAAMLSNVSSACRGIYSKKTMTGKPLGENLTAANMYAVLTIIATVILTPLALAIEGPRIGPVWEAAMASGLSAQAVIKDVLMSAVYYYLYNEVAFLALEQVNPVTHAVANTIKRVVIIIAAIIAFGTPVTFLGSLGSGIAIFGVLLYSLAKQKFDK